MKLATTFIVLILILLNSCADDKKKTFDSKIKFIGVKDGYKEFQVSLNGNILFEYYLDSLDRVVQFSDTTNVQWRIAFDSTERISYIENLRDRNRKEQIWLNSKATNLIYRNEINERVFKTKLINYSHPRIEQTETFKNGNLWWLSQYKVFDLNQMIPIYTKGDQFIELTDYPDEINLNKMNKLKFAIFSYLPNYQLLIGDWNSSFDIPSKIDTININRLFEYDFTPQDKKDTIRFILMLYDENFNYRPSIKYELPILNIAQAKIK